ncbi:ribose 5-phosphate isomerase B [Candidatus Pacearchaeota archaeon]|nr:MAG: ribose 5-phosphate isomerase B [Candidatus Pacearchaeota archaeon]
MKIGIGSDHRGFELKEKLKKYLIEKGFEVKDFGVFSSDSVDYPDIAFPLSEEVSKGKLDYGILMCYTGIGMSISANKVKGIRAALCVDEQRAELSRRHNNANILVLPAGFIDFEKAKKICDIFFKTNFEGGRHLRRIEKISKYEEERV